ncbi:MAG: hypothetical protein N3G21_03965 [Candidatus Hydrogenedentes bacterium]|nr:hypothetical protein [Candidatus Hydrogenedentota bacterium]
MKHLNKISIYAKPLPLRADSELEKQQQIAVWNSAIEMLASLFELIFKVTDKIKGAQQTD